MNFLINRNNRDISYWNEKLKPEKWQKLLLSQKEKVIKNIFVYLSNNLPNNTKDIHFFDSSNSELNANASGIFNSETKTIYINKDIIRLSISGYGIYNTISHELWHSHQNYINPDKYNVILNTKNININHNINNLYICPISYINDAIEALSNIYYHLNIYEREAWSYGNANESLLHDTDDNTIDTYLKQFKSTYDCYYLSNKEIYNLLDTCFDKVYNNQLPKDNLEATIMYDIYVLAMYQSNSIDKTNLIRLLNYTNKAKILEEKGFEIYSSEFIPSNSLKDKCKDIRNNKEYSLSLLKSLNNIQVRNNPDFINMMLHFYEKESTDILKHKGVSIENFINNNDKEEIEFDKT